MKKVVFLLLAISLLFPAINGCGGEKGEYSLTIGIVGQGNTDPSPGKFVYEEDTEVVITAIPDQGWELAQWVGDASGSDLEITMTIDSDKTVTAQFVKITYELAVSIGGSGTVILNPPEGPYIPNSQVLLAAVPGSGFSFDHWSGDLSGSINPITITMDSDKNVTAFFSTTYSLSVSIDPEGTGTVTLDPLEEAYLSGTEVTLTAIPSPGCEFSHWSGDASGTDPEIIITVDSACNITANFIEAGPPVPSVGTIWVYQVTYGDEVTEWTLEVTGEEAYEGEDCYVVDTSFSTTPVRKASGAEIWISGGTTWNSKATLDSLRTEAPVLLGGALELTSYIDRSYVGDHGWEFSVGKAWTYEESVVLDPPLKAGYLNTVEVEVVAVETVLGYSCYKIEHTLVAVDGESVEATLLKTEWWSGDVCGMVKQIDHTTYEEIETQELKLT